MNNIIEKLGITKQPWILRHWNQYGKDERCDIEWEDSQNVCDCIYSKADANLFLSSPYMLKAMIDTAVLIEIYIEKVGIDIMPGDFLTLSHNNKMLIDTIERASDKSWSEIQELLE